MSEDDTRARSARPTPPAWSQAIPAPHDELPAEIEEFLDWLRVQRNRPATTVRAYRQSLRKFVGFMRSRNADTSMCGSIDRAILRRYQVELADVLPYPRSRAQALVALRSFLAFAFDEGWTASDLSRQVVLPRFVMGDPHPLPTEDVPRLLAALPHEQLRDQRDRALLHLLLTTGCRISEACSLNRRDVRAGGFRVLGKGGKNRTVYLTDDAFAAVQEYLEHRGPDDSAALFISVAPAELPHGHALPHNRLTPDGARRALASLRRRLAEVCPEVAEIAMRLRSPHVARHTAATMLLEATGGDARLVQEVLGHATLETLRIYTEITDTRKRAAYERFGDWLRIGGRPPGRLDWPRWLSGEFSTCRYDEPQPTDQTGGSTWTTR